MPTLFRLMSTVAIVAVAVYAALWATATFVAPQPRQIVQVITVPGFTRGASPDGAPSSASGIATAAGDTRIGRSVASTLEDQARILTRHHHARAQSR